MIIFIRATGYQKGFFMHLSVIWHSWISCYIWECIKIWRYNCVFTEPSQIWCTAEESNSRTTDPKHKYLIWLLKKLFLLVISLDAATNNFKVRQGSVLQYVHNKHNLLWSCFTGVCRIVCSAKRKKAYCSSSKWHTMVIIYILLGL